MEEIPEMQVPVNAVPLCPSKGTPTPFGAENSIERNPNPLMLELFGPGRLLRGGASLPRLRTRKGLSLLAFLALQRNRPLSRPHIAVVLWPDSPDPQSLYNLRRALSDLRGVFGPDAARLRADGPSLGFDIEGIEVDLLAFDSLVGRNEQISLERAVDLYRGPLLEGFDDEWIDPERR